MRVDFFLYSVLEKRRLPVNFLKKLNWPIALPQKGWKITFAVKSKDPNDNLGQLTGEVIDEEQQTETHTNLWMDMGKFTKRLQNGLVKVIGWKKAFTAPSQG